MSRAKHDIIHTRVKDGWCWWHKKSVPRRYGAGRAREGRTRSQEGLVGRSAAGATEGVAETWSSTTVDDSGFRPTPEATWRGLP